MLIVAPFLCGLIFGAGLLVSGMVQPTKVLAFLDIFGVWDPSLAVVMAAALAVAIPGFMLTGRRGQPILARQNFLPTKTQLDAPLLLGAGLFGIGWGLVGLCGTGAGEPCDAVAGRVRLRRCHGRGNDRS
jgi:uncharacterized membrane protein YedE/YeeE